MTLTHKFSKVSGFSGEGFHAIGYRFEGDDFSFERCESWLFRKEGNDVLSENRRTWLTGVWASPSDAVFTTDAVFHCVRVFRGRGRDWACDTVELPATLEGVWGLDDDCVWAWGLNDGAPVLFRYDGAKWAQVESPGEVLAMHGVRRDLVFAVGTRGLIARWNGSTWTRMESPAVKNLASVAVVSDDEVWAGGPSGELLSGSVYGWMPSGVENQGILSLAKWRGELWAGVNMTGLSRLVDGAFVPERTDFVATSLDAREDLVMASPNGIGGTKDGKAFRGFKRESFMKTADRHMPAWKL